MEGFRQILLQWFDIIRICGGACAAQWVLLEEGKITRPQVLIRRFSILFDELGVTGDPKAVCERYERYLAGEAWFVPGAEALLKALMVGDSLTSDIRGGRNAGMATCWFNPQKKPWRKDIRPDFEIHSPEELPPLLAGERPDLI